MVDESNATRPVNSKSRSRFAIGILLLIILFIAYGAFERSRLIPAAVSEKEASKAIRALHGAVIESTVQDWRVVFVNDQPQIAQRVGGVYIPHEGQGPGYTQKVAEQLKAFELCNELIISYGPVSGGMRMGPAPKRILKPGEIPPEPLDLSAIRKQFPRLKVSGEEFLNPKVGDSDVHRLNSETPSATIGEPALNSSADDAKKKES